MCKSFRSRQELSNELRDVQEEFSEYVRSCYGLMFNFSFFSLSPCPFFSTFFSNQIAIQRSMYLQKLASI